MTNLLAIDFDYFFPVVERTQDGDPGEWQLYDWGHSEQINARIGHALWAVREMTFERAGKPLPGLSGRERTFWSRFAIRPDARLYHAESNALAAETLVTADVDEVWLFDAHHDGGGYSRSRTLADILDRGYVSCEDWMVQYAPHAELHVRYPAWRHYALDTEPDPIVPIDRAIDDDGPVPGTFDRIFVCRSSTWVPPWLDPEYEKFLASAPVAELIDLDRRPHELHEPEEATA